MASWITWTAIIINWICLLFLNWLLSRSRRRQRQMYQELLMWAQLCGHTMAKLHNIAPNARVDLPEDVFRWAEAMHMEYMVYGDEKGYE